MARHAASAVAVLAVLGVACYSTGGGTAPDTANFYFPVGLAVSRGGNVLYAINSDFDLQYNGGTLQSFDLNAIRVDTVALMTQTATSPLPFAPGYSYDPTQCPTPTNPPPVLPGGGRIPLTEFCAPPMNTAHYRRDAVIVGAFATDLQLVRSVLNPTNPGTADRLFAPIRGNATLSWADVIGDDPTVIPTSTDPTVYLPFDLSHKVDPSDTIGCGADKNGGLCDSNHQAGTLNDKGNTRGLAMPGEPFAMARTQDDQAIAITHQSTTETSLYLSGMNQGFDDAGAVANTPPSIQFILTGVPTGGIGLAAVPLDPAAIPAGQLVPRPAFLQTSNAAAEVDLLRYYSDEGYFNGVPNVDGVPVVSLEDGGFLDAAAGDGGLGDGGDAGPIAAKPIPISTNLRPFLIKEQVTSLVVNASGVDSRGVAIDPTARIACEQALPAGTPSTDPSYIRCAQLPARVFIANRSPNSLILGEIGGTSATGDGKYDPDLLTVYGNLELSVGPSNVYLAPIVDSAGNYALRVFIVCFDEQSIFVYDPDAGRLENIIRVGPGPFAMTFDNFDWTEVATHAHVPQDPRNASNKSAWSRDVDLKSYRFAYVASFTDSFMQLLDLDQSFTDKNVALGSTFETIVYTVGVPTQPKGSTSQ